MQKPTLRGRLIGTVAATTAIAVTGLTTPSFAVIEEIQITAERREANLQSVPIAVTAFDASALEAKQIDTFSDLQFNTPNVTFSKTNFTGANFQIRGIGANLTAQSGDAGTGIHINDAPINSARIFETEYFDVERIEVARGPQGTLFGRNSTGGAVNMITKKPTDEHEGELEVQYGNYSHRRVKGFLNIPVTDKFGIRLAGLQLSRDGYTENVFTGNDIDGRDQLSIRGSFQWNPMDDLSIDLMLSYFEEDSTRSRAQKQLCLKDPADPNVHLLGCSASGLGFDLPSTRALAFDTLASAELFFGLETTPVALGGFGGYIGILAPFATRSIFVDNNAGATVPTDPRQVNIDFEPTYESDEYLATLQFQQNFDRFTFTSLTSYQETFVRSEQDYDLAVGNTFGPMFGASTPVAALGGLASIYETPGVIAGFGLGALVDGLNPFTPSEAALVLEHMMGLITGNDWSGTYSNGLFPISDVHPDDMGIFNDHIRSLSRATTSYDRSSTFAEQITQEFRINSDLDGPFNFLLGGFYMNYEAQGEYYVFQQTLDHVAAALSTAISTGNGFAPPFILASPFFNSNTVNYELDSMALFGEAYYEINDDLKLTGGLRYTIDEKTVTDRNPLFATLTDCIGTWMVDFPTTCPTRTTQTDEWKEFTGRIGFDWTTALPYADNSLIYGFVSRGYKGGGFNPNFTTSQKALAGANVPTRFDPEFILAFELGAKNTFADGRFQANLAAFYYDYEGMQFTNIILNTSVNANVDAKIAGLEGEFVFAPNDNWLFNANVSYLHSEVGESLVVDPRDPTGGLSAADVTLFADVNLTTAGGNCVITHAGLTDPITLLGAGAFPLGNYTLCPSLQSTILPILQGIDPGYDFALGVPVNLSGNRLSGAPEWSVSLGGQNTLALPNMGGEVVTRVDYYWQGSSFSRIHNGPADKIDSWDQWNASVTYNADSGNWYAKAYIQNITDANNVTGAYLGSPSTGLFTNQFIGEPRLFGLGLGIRF